MVADMLYLILNAPDCYMYIQDGESHLKPTLKGNQETVVIQWKKANLKGPKTPTFHTGVLELHRSPLLYPL